MPRSLGRSTGTTRSRAGKRVEIEPELQDAVLDEVETGRIEKLGRGRASHERRRIGQGRNAVPPARLAAPLGSRAGTGSSVLRLATFLELGGAQHIVEDHLERALAALTPSQQDAAPNVFGHLVTPSGTKIAHGLSDLASYASLSESELDPTFGRWQGNGSFVHSARTAVASEGSTRSSTTSWPRPSSDGGAP